jgi:hypothetical protein
MAATDGFAEGLQVAGHGQMADDIIRQQTTEAV